MTISQSTLKEFAKAVAPPKQKSEGTMVTGTAKEYDGGIYVQIDGSEQLTPIASSTAGIKDGDRITVMVKDHKVTATGNVSMPSTNQGDLDDLHSDISGEFNNKIGEFEEVIASKATIEELEAQTARIDTLTADNVTIKETLTAETARINNLEANKANIEDLEAMNAHISNLEADMLTAEVADITYAKIDDLEAVSGDFYTLQADYADFKTVTADDISANTAKIEHLESTMITTDNLDAKYAKIDFANIGEAAIEKLFSESGIIGDLVMSDGHVTGTLVGVTIKGDLIEGGTVVADKLVIKGEDGLFYKLNTDGVDISAEQTEYNSLNGSVITAKSITAEKVNVDDLVAFGATIGGFNIDTDRLYSGVKSSVDNTTPGVYMDDTGQFALGNATDYLKFYKDGSNWKLDISASSIKFGSSSTSLEQTITNIQNAAEAAEEAASNANSNASDAAEKADQLEQSLNDYKDVVAGSYATKAELENSGNSILATVEETYQIKGDYVTDEESALVLEADGGVVQIGENAGLPPEGVTVYGQTRQNLWVNPTNNANSGVTLTNKVNGSIVVAGTATSAIYFRAPRSYALKPSTQYTLSIDKTIAQGCYVMVVGYDADGMQQPGDAPLGHTGYPNTSVTFSTRDDTASVEMQLYVSRGAVLNGIYRVMLNEGSEAQPWCPPGLNSVNTLRVPITTGNLISSVANNDTRQGVTVTTDASTQTFSVHGTNTGSATTIGYLAMKTNEIACLNIAVSNGEYKLISNIKSSYPVYVQMNAARPDGSGAIMVARVGNSNENGHVIEIPEGYLINSVFLGIITHGVANYDGLWAAVVPVDYPDDEHVLWDSSFTEIPLLGNELRSLPDGTRDELHIDADGNVEIVKRISCDDLPSAGAAWYEYETSGAYFTDLGTASKYKTSPLSDFMCDTLPPRVSPFTWQVGGPDGISPAASNNPPLRNIYVRRPEIISVETAAGFFVNHPTKLQYELATFQTIPLGKVDLPALNAAGANVCVVASDSSGNAYTLEPDIHVSWYGKNANVLGRFASKAELKVESDQIKATVEETYSTKEEVSAVEDKADAAQDALDSYKSTVSTTYATKSEVTQTANSIKSEVSETYTSKTDAAATYATKQSVTTVEQTVDGLKSTVSSNYTTLNNKFSSYYTKTEVDQKDDSIKSTVSSVQTTANNALAKASTVEQTADGLEVRLTQAEKDVDTAQSTANTAKTNATTAQNTANNALNRVTLHDTRNDNQNPQWYFDNYPRQLVQEFKYCSKIGVSGGTYCYLSTYVPWGDPSGGWPKQTAKVDGTGKEYWRVGTSATAWSSWIDAYGTAVNSAKTATNYLKFDSSGLCVGNMTGTLGYNTLIKSTGVDIRNGSTVLASFGASEINLGKNSTSSALYVAGGSASLRVDSSNGNRIEMRSISGAGISNKPAGDGSIKNLCYVSIGSQDVPGVKVGASGYFIDLLDRVRFGNLGNNVISDIVIAQGKSGEWTYRRWSSGVQEAWLVHGGWSFPANTRSYTDFTLPWTAHNTNYCVTFGLTAFNVTTQPAGFTGAHFIATGCTTTKFRADCWNDGSSTFTAGVCIHVLDRPWG